MKTGKILSGISKIKSNQPLLFWTAVLLIIWTCFLRFSFLHQFLPYIHLDENELVEFPLALFGPDKDPHWYKYGPLYWYVLKIMYWFQITFSGVSTNEFVENYFFNPNSYFLTSRFLSTTLQFLIAFIAFFSARLLNKKSALLALCIAVVPVGDLMTNFYPRIDVMLAFWSSMTLLIGLKIIKSKNQTGWIYYALLGLSFACCFSSKPIPSLLILPALFLVFYFSHLDSKSKSVNYFNPILKILTSKETYIFLIFIVIGIYLTNPYAFKSFDAFYAEQIKAIQEEGSRNFASGADITRFFRSFGIPYLLAGIAAILYSLYDGFKRKKYGIVVLSVYVLTYWGAFAMGAARDYFYVPLIMPIAVLTAYQIRRLLKYLESRGLSFVQTKLELSSLIILLVLIVMPLFNSSENRLSLIGLDGDKYHTTKVAEKWVEQNVPANSRILYYGYYTSMPRIIDNNVNEQARYGDYFMYGRGNNRYWIDRYSAAYTKVARDNSIKKYDLVYNLDIPNGSGGTSQYYSRYVDDNVTQNIFTIAQSNNIDYIMTTYELPESNNLYDPVGDFTRETLGHGGSMYIYKKKNI